MSLLLRVLTATNTYIYAASGGITFSGSAVLSKTKDFVTSGGLTFSGAAALSKSKDFVASGGFTLSGTAVITKSKNFTASGGFTFGGSASIVITKVFDASGGVLLDGLAAVTKTKNFNSSGGAVFGGAATTQFISSAPTDHIYVGAGSVAFDGSGTLPGFGGNAIVEFVPAIIPIEVIGGAPGPSKERWHYLPGPPVHHDYEGHGVIRFGGAAKVVFRRATVIKKRDIDRLAIRNQVVDEILRRKREIEDQEDEDVLVALLTL